MFQHQISIESDVIKNNDNNNFNSVFLCEYFFSGLGNSVNVAVRYFIVSRILMKIEKLQIIKEIACTLEALRYFSSRTSIVASLSLSMKETETRN